MALAVTIMPNVGAAQDENEAQAQPNPEVFNVPEGKDSEFYETRLKEIAAEFDLEAKDCANQEEKNVLWKKMGGSATAIYQYTDDDSTRTVNKRAMSLALQCYMITGDVEAIQKLRDVATFEAHVKALDRAVLLTTIRNFVDKNDKEGLSKALDDFFAKSEDPNVANCAHDLATTFAQYDSEIAKAFSDRVVQEFQNGGDVQKEIAKSFEARVRFNNLVGNELKIEGLDIDGIELDWSSYRGKVVLVDFWATWCPPCRAEHPNVQALYEKYHEAGFDVLGISCDADVDALKKFVEEHKIPWNNGVEKLTQEANEKDGKEFVSPYEYYGIGSIPTMILVGKDGKVLDARARGERLKKLLEEQFPDVK